jgi:hypothetical protein
MPGCMEDFCNNNYDNKCADCGKKLCNEHSYEFEFDYYCSKCMPGCTEEGCDNTGE